MGKLRHGALPAPDPAAWRAAATSAPRHPRLQPGQPPPSSSSSPGTSSIDPHGSGEALEEENKAINHPCFTAAPARRQGRLPLCTAGDPPHQSDPGGQRPARQLPPALPAPPLPRGHAGHHGTKPAPARHGGGCPRPPRSGTASKARRMLPGSRPCYLPLPSAGVRRRRLRAEVLRAEEEPASAPGCRRARPGELWTPREGPRYPQQSLPFAVSSMTHGGCFLRLCPALLQTVHSVWDGACSSPAFLSPSQARTDGMRQRARGVSACPRRALGQSLAFLLASWWQTAPGGKGPLGAHSGVGVTARGTGHGTPTPRAVGAAVPQQFGCKTLNICNLHISRGMGRPCPCPPSRREQPHCPCPPGFALPVRTGS